MGAPGLCITGRLRSSNSEYVLPPRFAGLTAASTPATSRPIQPDCGSPISSGVYRKRRCAVSIGGCSQMMGGCPSCRGGMSVWRSSVCVSHSWMRGDMPGAARVPCESMRMVALRRRDVWTMVALARPTFNRSRGVSTSAQSYWPGSSAGAGLRSGGCCRSSWGIGDGGLVGVAHRRGEDRAQQRFALVEEQLRVIGRRIHLAAVAGDGAAEGPVQVQGGAHHDAKSAATAKIAAVRTPLGVRLRGRWRGLRSLPAFPAW